MRRWWGETGGSRQQFSLPGEPALPSRRHQCHSARLNHVFAAKGNNKPHAYLPTHPTNPPTFPTHPHGRARRQRAQGTAKERQSFGENVRSRAEPSRAAPLAACLRPPAGQPPPNSCRRRRQGGPLAAANVTLVNGDAAAVSITVHQRILSPASLVGTHAAASDHFPHAEPI